jgi:diguanylate cyclase (GGDEF)-like protein
MLDDKEVALRVSVGVSVYPDDGESLATLLQNADAAMYRVKVSRKRDMSKAGSYTIASQQQQV